MSRRKVTYARIHDIKVVIPGFGQVETEFPAKHKNMPGLEMSFESDALEVKWKNGGNTVECAIPLANVQFMLFAPEDKS